MSFILFQEFAYREMPMRRFLRAIDSTSLTVHWHANLVAGGETTARAQVRGVRASFLVAVSIGRTLEFRAINDTMPLFLLPV